ncbi:MAG: putative lipid II flippase FtsW [Candidatus Sungiibacteriota bacterium]
MRVIAHPVDKSLLAMTLALFVCGILVLGSASMALAYKNLGSVSGYAARQLLIGGGVGLAAMAITSRIHYRVWRKLALPLLLISFGCLALLFMPHFGLSSGGATRWLRIGSLSFQPSELLKISFIIYLASWLDARRREIASVSYGMIPFTLMISVVAVFLVMQKDVGTLCVVVATAILLYFFGGGKTSQIIILVLLGIAALLLLIQLEPYRAARFAVFFNPATEPLGAGYQIKQASLGIGSGGFWGTGFGRSVQKYNYLPEPMGDSIFAVFSEEMGFLGATALLSFFFLFYFKCLRVARSAPDVFGKLLAAGIATGIMSQAFINMAAISGLIPLTGIPLPFISYGGTSLAMTLASVGILLNISRYS